LNLSYQMLQAKKSASGSFSTKNTSSIPLLQVKS
jgi:hypothetical protein